MEKSGSELSFVAVRVVAGSRVESGIVFACLSSGRVAEDWFGASVVAAPLIVVPASVTGVSSSDVDVVAESVARVFG